MKSPATLKKTAQKILLTAWCESVLILVISFCIYSVAISVYLLVVTRLGILTFHKSLSSNNISLEFILISIGYFVLWKILLIPLSYGTSWYYSMLKPNQTPAILSIFGCYRSRRLFFQTIKIDLAVASRKMILWIPLTALSIGYGIVFYILIQNIESEILQWIVFAIAIILISINTFIYGIYKSRFLLVEYIYTINPSYPVKKIVNDSVKIIRSHKDYLLSVGAAFVPWLISAIFVIPLIFAIPYFSLTLILAYNEIVNDYNEEKLFAGEEENIIASPALH